MDCEVCTSLKDDRLEAILRICINGEFLEKFDSVRSLDLLKGGCQRQKNATAEDID